MLVPAWPLRVVGKGREGVETPWVDIHVAWKSIYNGGWEGATGPRPPAQRLFSTLSSPDRLTGCPSPCPTPFIPTHSVHLSESHALNFLQRHLRRRMPGWGSCCGPSPETLRPSPAKTSAHLPRLPKSGPGCLPPSRPPGSSTSPPRPRVMSTIQSLLWKPAEVTGSPSCPNNRADPCLAPPPSRHFNLSCNPRTCTHTPWKQTRATRHSFLGLCSDVVHGLCFLPRADVWVDHPTSQRCPQVHTPTRPRHLTHAHTHRHACAHAQARMHRHARTQAQARTRTGAHTRTGTLAQARTRTHRHARAHARTGSRREPPVKDGADPSAVGAAAVDM